MTELFENVSEKQKNNIRFMIDLNLLCQDPRETAQRLIDFRKTLMTEEEKEFMDFYFNMRIMEIKGELKNEDSNDLR